MSRREYAPVHPAGGQAPPAIIWCTTPERPLVLHHRPHLVRQGGGQVWQEQMHDRGQATTEWAGKRLHTMRLGLFLSVLRGRPGVDIESECALLHQMMIGADWHMRKEPAPVRLNFGPGQQMRWMITDLIWDETPVIDHRGRRVQTEVEVDLIEFQSPVLSESPARAVARFFGAT